MRILITGFKQRHTRHWPTWDAENWSIVTASHGLLHALPVLGHDVRYVVPSPDRYNLHDVDLVLIFADNTRYDGAAYALPTMILAHQCRQRGVPYMFVVSDANLRGVAGALTGIQADDATIERHARRWGWCSTLHAHVQANARNVVIESDQLSDGNWPPVLGYAFPWGQPDALRAEGIPFRYLIDPTPLTPTIPFSPAKQQQRQWVWASMRRDPAVQWWGDDLTWPLDRFGQGRMRHEREVVQATAGARGRLMHVYPHARGAWWRHGIVTAMRTGTIVCCHPDEVSSLGGPFLVLPQSVEEMSEPRLLELAAAQARRFDGLIWGRRRALRRIEQMLKEVSND